MESYERLKFLEGQTKMKQREIKFRLEEDAKLQDIIKKKVLKKRVAVRHKTIVKSYSKIHTALCRWCLQRFSHHDICVQIQLGAMRFYFHTDCFHNFRSWLNEK